MKYYKIQYGFDADEYYSVDESELPKALQAQMTGAVCILNEGTINGERIIAIRPDYNRLMGYHRDYQLTGEDYDQIGQQAQREHMQLMEDIKLRFAGKPPIERPREITSGVKKLAEKMNIPARDR